MALNLDREAGWGTHWLALVGLIGLVAVALVIVGDVLLRWLFNSPVDGVVEIARLVAAVAIASFFPMALVDRHNISIRFLGAALGPRAQLWLDTLADVVTALFFLMVGWQFILFTLEMSESGETTWILAWSKTPWWTVTTIFMVICIPIQLMVLVHQFRAAVSGDTSSLKSGHHIDTES